MSIERVNGGNNYQALASFQGDKFHKEAIDALTMAGFEIADQHYTVPDVGVELDCITNNRHGLAMPWEFKGSWQGDRPGLRRTDTLKKAVGGAYMFAQSEMALGMTPLLVMTTHFPQTGMGVLMLRCVKRNVVFAFVDSRDSKTLKWLYNADEAKLRDYLNYQLDLLTRN